MFTREALTILDWHLLVSAIHFVTAGGDDALVWGDFSQLINPSISLIQTLTISDIIDYHGGIGVTQVHAIEHHVAFLARKVVKLQIHLLIQRLDRDSEILTHDWNSRLFVWINLLAEYLAYDASLSCALTSNYHYFKRVAAHFVFLQKILIITILFTQKK